MLVVDISAISHLLEVQEYHVANRFPVNRHTEFHEGLVACIDGCEAGYLAFPCCLLQHSKIIGVVR